MKGLLKSKHFRYCEDVQTLLKDLPNTECNNRSIKYMTQPKEKKSFTFIIPQTLALSALLSMQYCIIEWFNSFALTLSFLFSEVQFGIGQEFSLTPKWWLITFLTAKMIHYFVRVLPPNWLSNGSSPVNIDLAHMSLWTLKATSSEAKNLNKSLLHSQADRLQYAWKRNTFNMSSILKRFDGYLIFLLQSVTKVYLNSSYKDLMIIHNES